MTEGPEAIDLGRPDTTGELLDQVRQMLVRQMVIAGGGVMKILRLDLRAFGPFTDFSLDLSAGSEGFIGLWSQRGRQDSALRALRNLLYGIPGNTADDFIHNNRTCGSAPAGPPRRPTVGNRSPQREQGHVASAG